MDARGFLAAVNEAKATHTLVNPQKMVSMHHVQFASPSLFASLLVPNVVQKVWVSCCVEGQNHSEVRFLRK